MFNMNKMARAAVAILISTPLLMASDCEAGRRKKRSPQPAAEVHRPIRTLPDNSITVGCCGIDCVMHGGNGRMMRGVHGEMIELLGYYKGRETTANQEIDKMIKALESHAALQKHNHPGHTLDLFPAAEGAESTHIQADWHNFEISPGSIDAIFFEQLPPTGRVTTHGDHDSSRETFDFLPRAIEKARLALAENGELVIQLALDAEISQTFSKEDLADRRSQNPFVGSFDDIRGHLLKALHAEGQSGPKSICDAIKFFKKITNIRFTQASRIAVGATSCMKEFTRMTLNACKEIQTDTTQVKREDVDDPNERDPWDIVVTVTQLLTVFRQGEMMVEYLNTHGFKRAELKWLEAGEHEFNPHAGWFLRAVKDPNYVGASASADVGASSSAGAPPTSTELAAAEESGASAAS